MRPPFLRRQARAPTCQPCPSPSEDKCACSARLRATALALSGDEAQHVRFRRACAPRQAGGTCFTHCERALHEREAAVHSAPARAPMCQPCPSLREVACACSALARLCARSLWGRGPARALPTRVRRAALATLSACTVEGHCTSEKPPFIRRQSVLPCASPAPHFARWLARVARLCLCAGSLWGRGPARGLSARARAAPRWRYLLHAPWKGTALARSRRSFGARPVLPRGFQPPALARVAAQLICEMSSLRPRVEAAPGT